MSEKIINKLVRDKVIETIREQGNTTIFHFADKEEYFEYLKKKLIEEVNEYLNDLNIEEFADVVEVMRTIAEIKNIDYSNLEQIIKEKNAKAGKFTQQIILEKIIIKN